MWLYQHAAPMVEALRKSRELARYIEDTMGGSQKLLRGNYAFSTLPLTGR